CNVRVDAVVAVRMFAELIFAVFELAARLESDDPAHENIRLVDHSPALEYGGDIAGSQPARNIDHLVVGERPWGIKALLSEKQRGADRNRNHDQNCKDCIPNHDDRVTRTTGATARHWRTFRLERGTRATRDRRLCSRQTIATS